MDGQLIKFEHLPSKGIKYPKDIEIYVKPLSVKEQIEMDRYGISQAEYYQLLLNGITIKGDFNKDNLLFYDVQLIDIVRRLYTFDVEEEIQVTNYPCMNRLCDGTISYSFHINQVEFTDYKKEAFDKEYTFSDGLEIVVSPLTVSEFIRMAKRYFTNNIEKFEADVILGYYVYCTKAVKDREFKNIEERNKFLMDYFGNLTKYKDTKILKEIEELTTCKVVPFKTICPKCGEITEVGLYPSAQFQQ